MNVQELLKLHEKDPKDCTVVVAMSGGVDSAVAAILLKEQGYKVIGMALQVTDYTKYHKEGSKGTCCSLQDMDDARRVAEALEIPFYVLNTEKTFDKNVVDYFVQDYLDGRTPNPCVMCNTKVKFNHLYRIALDLGADFVATGHYAKIERDPEQGFRLLRGEDARKDQSYFLFSLNQIQLGRTLFPVGHLCKEEVRAIARQYDLPIAVKPESQDICFVPKGDYSRFIQDYTGKNFDKGVIEHEDGTALGSHEGVFQYTVGQRKRLGDSLNRAKQLKKENADDLFVSRVDVTQNKVVLGSSQSLLSRGAVLKDVHWINPFKKNTEALEVKIRYSSSLVMAQAKESQDEKRVELYFEQAQRAVTPGQACVFFDGPYCMGGGWIEEAIH